MFSVIIPLYNKELDIKNTVESVLAQNYSNFEVIIVNDGSTDNSLKVALEIKDSRIRVIDKVNGGVSSARNRGIKEARNKWITFLDGDDIWLADHLEVLNDLIGRFSEVKVFATSFKYSNGISSIKNARKNGCEKINYFIASMNEFVFWTGIMLINKECFENIGFFDENISRGEDIDMWVRLARNYEVVKCDDITAIYNLDADNRISTYKSIYLKSYISKISFRKSNTKEEKRFLRKIIIDKLKSSLLAKDFKICFLLLIRYNINLL